MITKNKIYSEVYSVLLSLGDTFISCIPRGILNTIKFSRDTEYTPVYDKNKPLYKQNISTEALNVIAKLHMDYWCDSSKEKTELYEQLHKNEEKANEKLLKNIFNNT